MHSDLYLFAYALGKLSLTTGFGPATLFVCAAEAWMRAERRRERRKQVAKVIQFPSWGGRTALADRNLLHERQASAGARPLISGR
jgi:hypothetical protein